MSQEPLPDQGRSYFRTMPCPSCGQDVVWTIASKPEDKISCNNNVGERNHLRACGFTLRRAEWDYIRDRPDSDTVRTFLKNAVRKHSETRKGNRR